jgi:hypothetical protein
MYPHERAHYRLRYPDRERPVFVAGERDAHDVVDCSEAGFRFRAPPHATTLPEVGAPARGVIRFRSGRVAEVAGVVVRIQEREVAVHLTQTAIPYRLVVQEQMRLRQRYPFFDRERA